MSDIHDLRVYARNQIPALLDRNGGEMLKTDLHKFIEVGFSRGQDLPAYLNETYPKSNCRRATNAIAWALHDLVRDKVLAPSSGSKTVKKSSIRRNQIKT